MKYHTQLAIFDMQTKDAFKGHSIFSDLLQVHKEYVRGGVKLHVHLKMLM